MGIIYPADHEERIKDYNNRVSELAAQREKFYAKNPDFPIKTMYMNVMAPPQKLVIRILNVENQK